VIYIFLCILASTGILIIFRLLDRFNAKTAHSILVNYGVAAVASLMLFSVPLSTLVSKWSILAALEGIAFFGVFHLMAKSAKTSGVAFTGVASKMSVVIPITIGLVFFDETKNSYVILGVLLGLGAVLLSASDNKLPDNWKWPILVFLGSGLIDASFKVYQVWGLTEEMYAGFIAVIFAFACLTALIHHLRESNDAINKSSWVGGIVLGLLNLGTVYFLLKALATPSLDSTFVYALNSFGVVISTAMVGWLLFKETISVKGRLGILLAILSIVLLQVAY